MTIVIKVLPINSTNMQKTRNKPVASVGRPCWNAIHEHFVFYT